MDTPYPPLSPHTTPPPHSKANARKLAKSMKVFSGYTVFTLYPKKRALHKNCRIRVNFCAGEDSAQKFDLPPLVKVGFDS
jgi:hypothetical protein